MQSLIILPTYNEAGNIRGIAERIISLGDYIHILIIDDNSTDGTQEIARGLAARYKDRVFLHGAAWEIGVGFGLYPGV